MTSSVTQELIGYRDVIDKQGERISTQVISYGIEDITSWAEIHSKVDDGRLVFVSDSAGHPRFRRTTVRGLVGWDPHWTLLCIPVDNEDGSLDVNNASPTLPATADSSLSYAHLQLCLNLELPLVVILTKYDLATKSSLRQTLSRLLTTLKDAGRKPCLISVPASADLAADLNTIVAHDLLQADENVQTLQLSPLAAVPIIFTSAVDGRGINKLHAFLRGLPLPNTKAPPPGTPRTLFYVEDVYSSVSAPSNPLSHTNGSFDRSAVIGGHLPYGTLNIGDEMMLGPYSTDIGLYDGDSGGGRPTTGTSPVPTSRSFPGALNKIKPLRSRGSAHDKQTEWRRVRITSLRNLRLPVRTLHAGQVGTMGIVPVDLPIESPSILRIRKGMVLHSGGAKATQTISVRFGGTNAATVKTIPVGSSVTVYVASVRASARVVSIAAAVGSHNSNIAAPSFTEDDDDAAFGFGGFDDGDDDDDTSLGVIAASVTVVTFQFLGLREFVELDAKVLVLPGGGEKAVAGLEGFVGRVVEG
jgi:GTPase